jgi:hypothetical protein
MPENELIKMDEVKEKINEQVKVSFFNLIPDDAFKKLVEQELNAFFETETTMTIEHNEGGYNSRETWAWRTKMTPFRQMISPGRSSKS